MKSEKKVSGSLISAIIKLQTYNYKGLLRFNNNQYCREVRLVTDFESAV